MKISFGVKVLVVTICILISVIVAMVAAYIRHAPGSPVSEAALYGGGAFAGSLILCLTVLSALGVL